MSTAVPTNIRSLRRHRQWSQEHLAEQAGLSPTTVGKAERGGQVTTATLHAIARALEVSTSDLYSDRAITPRLDAQPDHHALARLRAVITPPVGITGTPLLEEAAAEGPVDLEAIATAVQRIETSYRGDRYDDVAEMLPSVIAEAHRAVAELETDQAYRTRAVALQMAGRYLTQVRMLSDALAALRASIRDAATAGDRTLAAVAINGQGWALTRQGRLAECVRLCTATADEVEPRMSTAGSSELAAWGNLHFRAAAAAIRDNDPDGAKEHMQMADAAASALGREVDSWATFGPLTMALKQAEFALIRDEPDLTLELAERLPDRRRVGDVTPINWERHHLDVAHAQVRTGDIDAATRTMTQVMQRSPEWMRRQNEAYQVVADMCEARPKRISPQVATLAAHLGVAA
ncbi:helix-turn-helix domain-containing protein [Nocardiopsis baichengensis]|uniref:helix-turn-helix domain-containing protein n=1 Tax=Nocardiopsis baichengensis TaxID=280240 RepID=UPI000349F712|nr:helix-turn-helix transcriptional regulator [Nocardiopsis baichengensis]